MVTNVCGGRTFLSSCFSKRAPVAYQKIAQGGNIYFLNASSARFIGESLCKCSVTHGVPTRSQIALIIATIESIVHILMALHPLICILLTALFL